MSTNGDLVRYLARYLHTQLRNGKHIPYGDDEERGFYEMVAHNMIRKVVCVTDCRDDPDVVRGARSAVLNRAAEFLDWQAHQHAESVADYTDLMRIWADNDERWETGS